MQQHCRIKLGNFIYPPETQLWSFCLCSGHSILVNFSETRRVTVVSLDVLYRAHAGLYRDTKYFFKPSHTSLKMAIFNLVKNCTSLWKYLNHFQIVCHKATSQENVMGFQIQI